MSGLTPDQRLRFEQILQLRRRWLKDQELSPREPVLPAAAPGPVDRFWARFLQPKSLWRTGTYKAYRCGLFTMTWLVIPAWISHYYIKYYLSEKPYALVYEKSSLYPGDVIAETGEVIPDFPEIRGHH